MLTTKNFKKNVKKKGAFCSKVYNILGRQSAVIIGFDTQGFAQSFYPTQTFDYFLSLLVKKFEITIINISPFAFFRKIGNFIELTMQQKCF